MAKAKYDELLITALACGGTVESAAQHARVSERSVYRRLSDPDFQQKLKDFQVDLVKRCSGLLTAASIEAVKTLLSLMERNVAASARLGAARTVIEIGVKMRELVVLEERLCAIERKLKKSTIQEKN